MTDFNPDTWRRAEAKRDPDMDIEDRIAATLVVDLLAHNPNWHIEVLDEEQEPACEPTRDLDTILKALFSTSEDWLAVHFEAPTPEDQRPDAWVRLIDGNGCDIISDYTVNLEPAMARANAIAAQYQ